MEQDNMIRKMALKTLQVIEQTERRCLEKARAANAALFEKDALEYERNKNSFFANCDVLREFGLVCCFDMQKLHEEGDMISAVTIGDTEYIYDGINRWWTSKKARYFAND